MPANEVRIGEWIARGVNLYKNNFVLLVATHFVAVMLGVISLGVLAGPMFAGLYMICLRLVDGTDPPPQVGDLFNGFSRFLQPFLFVSVWGAVLIVVAAALTHGVVASLPVIGPFVYALAVTALEALAIFGIPLIVDRGMEFWPASKISAAHVWSMYSGFIVLVFFSSLLSTCGVFLYGFGVFLTLPVHTCVVAIAYRESLAPLSEGSDSAGFELGETLE